MDSPLIEPGYYMLMSFSAVTGVHIHAESVQLAQGGEALQQQHYQASTFNSFHSTAQDVGCQSFKVL